MIQPSTILIADISGFTNFVSSTALEHSSHIVNELLEVIVESDELGLTVSEIEGDAVLFYKTGDPVPCETMVGQCLESFERFHQKLRVIERDSICQCGACQTATDLGLKFVSHFGDLKEISVANFRKASGLDMIVAHRLLKNDIDGNEYVIVTDAYREAVNQQLGCNLQWESRLLSYPDIGDVPVQYAFLEDIKRQIPDPPQRESPVVPAGDDALEVTIDAPLFKIYAKLLDVDKRMEWVVGLDRVENKEPRAHIGQRHLCVFGGMNVDFELVHGEIMSDHAVYSEVADFRGMPFKHQQTYRLARKDDNETGVRFEIKWGDDPEPPDDMKEMFKEGISASLESLKDLLEE